MAQTIQLRIPIRDVVLPVLREQQIDHRRVRPQLHVGAFLHRLQKMRRDLLTRTIGMKEDARARMRPLSREAQLSVPVARETHAEADELFDGLAGIFDHAAHGERVVLVMPRAHGIFEIALIVALVAQYADPALRQERVAALKV